MGKIDNTYTWKVGEQVRAKRVEANIPLNPTTAGESRWLSHSTLIYSPLFTHKRHSILSPLPLAPIFPLAQASTWPP